MLFRSDVEITGTGTFSGIIDVGDVDLDGDAARSVEVGRRTTSTYEGNDLSLIAGGAKAGVSFKAGGDLILSGGTSVGRGASNIYFKTATATGSPVSTIDTIPTTKWTIDSYGDLLSGTDGTVANDIKTTGTITGLTSLDVNGNIEFDAWKVSGETNTLSLDISTGATTLSSSNTNLVIEGGL